MLKAKPLLLLVAVGCGGVGSGPPLEPKLNVLEREVFAPTCALSGVCHGGLSPQQGLNLASPVFAKIVNQPSAEVAGRRLVVPGDPTASYLFEKISESKPTSGMRMPYTNGALAPDVIDAVRRWIQSGANND